MSSIKLTPKVWVVSEVFYPDETSTAYILTHIANELATQADVHVICGPSGYGDIKGSDLNLSKISFHRINLFNLDKNKLLQRLLRLIILSFSMFFIGLMKIGRRDKVLLVTNPAFAIPLFSLLRKLKGFNYFILVHDVFPENLIPAGLIKSSKNFLYRLLTSIFNWSYASANKLFVLGRDMKEVMRRKIGEKTKISIIENWSQTDEIYLTDFQHNELTAAKNLKEKIVLLFAGNLGRLQALEKYFEVIAKVKNPNVHFAFVGDGALLPHLKEIVAQNEIKNVSFWGSFPRDKQVVFLNASHFGVITLEEEVYGLGVPSKTYNILAAAKPVLFLGNKKSEVAMLTEEDRCGISFSWDQSLEIIKFIESLNERTITEYEVLGSRGRILAETKFSKENILNKFKLEILGDD
ncbi:glycosyltransferase family 4 protein [Pedobacter sp.]